MNPLTPAAQRALREEAQGTLRACEQLYARVWAMRKRGPLGRRVAPATRRELAIAYAAGGSCRCAICGGEHWSIVGDALVLAGTTARVCWPCGDEHDAALAADVLACAADECEQFVASKFPDAFLTWIDRLRRAGMEQEARALDERVRRHRQQVRRIKAAGLTDPATWLPGRGPQIRHT